MSEMTVAPIIILEDIVEIAFSPHRTLIMKEHGKDSTHYLGSEIVDAVYKESGKSIHMNRASKPVETYSADKGIQIALSDKVLFDYDTGRFKLKDCGFDLNINPFWIKAVYDKDNYRFEKRPRDIIKPEILARYK